MKFENTRIGRRFKTTVHINGRESYEVCLKLSMNHIRVVRLGLTIDAPEGDTVVEDVKS